MTTGIYCESYGNGMLWVVSCLSKYFGLRLRIDSHDAQ